MQYRCADVLHGSSILLSHVESNAPSTPAEPRTWREAEFHELQSKGAWMPRPCAILASLDERAEGGSASGHRVLAAILNTVKMCREAAGTLLVVQPLGTCFTQLSEQSVVQR